MLHRRSHRLSQATSSISLLLQASCCTARKALARTTTLGLSSNRMTTNRKSCSQHINKMLHDSAEQTRNKCPQLQKSLQLLINIFFFYCKIVHKIRNKNWKTNKCWLISTESHKTNCYLVKKKTCVSYVGRHQAKNHRDHGLLYTRHWLCQRCSYLWRANLLQHVLKDAGTVAWDATQSLK